MCVLPHLNCGSDDDGGGDSGGDDENVCGASVHKYLRVCGLVSGRVLAMLCRAASRSCVHTTKPTPSMASL